ncbi:uncharacterized protein HMPREF1541_09591 [Cyphellophora europaea CBS 101466]|uniref:BZIP domain-containing protein n=1 Tax=Cyphellophora europaea (strain CBS 101466) TaxID=1220924 RepID=W2SCJ6_CYPE1|nr:uncharacterized protein HMPREF1541_09591 [Cyphellophora europaea CBS 101466]ETN45758.1 hypothetical protein HMPREF1541_09591 [Cyphellophora europaea CBS 101466]
MPSSRLERGKPWANGRILSAEQRERKRRVDRLNKSRRREQEQTAVRDVKSQLATLTANLHSLQRALPDNANCLPRRFDTDLASTSDTTLPSNTSGPELSSAYFSFNVSSEPPVRSFSSDVVELEDEVPHVLPLPTEATVGDRCLLVSGARSFGTTVSIQDLFNQLLRQGCVSDRRLICTDEALNQNALIRGIVHGWHTVLESPFACPLWEVTSRLDKHIFGYSSLITRFCTLRMTHYMLLFMTQAITAAELPPWLRPRPSQLHLAHDLSVDVLPWPGLRERSVLDQETTKSNKFWREVIQLFRLNWPYSPDSAYQLDQNSGLYSFTGTYENHVREIRMWNVDPSFFKSFPATVDDIIPPGSLAPLYVRPNPLVPLEIMDAVNEEPSANRLDLLVAGFMWGRAPRFKVAYMCDNKVLSRSWGESCIHQCLQGIG